MTKKNNNNSHEDAPVQLNSGSSSLMTDPIKEINTEKNFWILTKTLYYQTIRAGLYQADNGIYRYLVKTKRLTSEEKELCRALHEEIKNNNHESKQERIHEFPSRGPILALIARKYPHILEERRGIIATSLFFHYDPSRWVRLFIEDADITAIFCPAPDTAILIRYCGFQEIIATNIILQRNHLDRLAHFFLIPAGIDPTETNIPDPIRFEKGINISITRQGDSAGWFWRIGIQKNGNNTNSTNPGEKREQKYVLKGTIKRSQISSNPEKHLNIPKRSLVSSPSSKDFQKEQRIEQLLSGIFERGDDFKENKPNENTKQIIETENTVSLTYIDRIIIPLKAWKKNISSIQSGKKSLGPSHDPPPVPVTTQAPSVMNIQTGNGIVAEEAYWLYQPHAYVAILQNQNKDRSYQIVEPDLSSRERIILEETHETLRDILVYDKPVMKGDLFLDYTEVAKVVKTYDPSITDDRLSVLYYYLRRNLNGYGKIDPLMYDELLEDISCNGHGLPVYIHHRYYGSIPTSVKYESEELNKFVLKLSQKADKQISLTSPLLDATLPNGARAQITYSDVVSTKGSSFTIRKFRSDPMTPATLMAFGTYNDELLAFIWLALENRQSLIVVGGTASGKTSTMNAFAFFIPPNSKIVSLEDTREIQIPQKNWLPVQTRSSNSANDRGNVDLFDLLKASLRQRPEYIIVGEVRGSEAQTLFQAMNSGHTTLSTLHAGNIEEALNRLTNEPINVPPAMFGALNLMVIQTFHYREGRMIRRCDAIHEIVLGENDKVGWNILYEYEPSNDSFRQVYTRSKILKTIQYMHNWSDDEIKYHLDLRAGFLKKLRNQYSADPELLIRMITDLRRKA